MASSILPNDDLKTFKDHFLDWCGMNYRKDFSVLIMGKPGVGTSSLVNALVGTIVAKCASKITSYCEVIKGILVRVYDSPALQDGTGDEKSYLADIEQKITGELDLVIFCLRMDDIRFNLDDKKTIQILTDAFGKELWQHAVIALTFANKLEDLTGGDKKAFFLTELENWREVINPFLRDSLEIDSVLLQSLPIVPTGYYRQPSGLPNCENWLSSFWSACYQVARSSAVFNLYRINRGRIRFPGSDNLAWVTGESEEETESQSAFLPIALTAAQSEIPVTELGEKEQESFFKKTWDMFKEHCLKVGVILGAIGTVGFTVLKLLK